MTILPGSCRARGLRHGASACDKPRGNSAYDTSEVVNACLKAGVLFSVVLAKSPAVAAEIAEIPEDTWAPVTYPGAVLDPDTSQLISDAEVDEIEYTAFASTKKPVTARLVVRRVRDKVKTEELFLIWRHHPVPDQ
ncbi:MAG: transposase, family protein [Frankiales bacterium]|nr:transposase, family protein [Frankiales bacterium]